MKCPECGSGTITFNTRDRDGGRYRRRECNSGHRFTTHEVPASTIDAAIIQGIDSRISLALAEVMPLIVAALTEKLRAFR